MQVKSRIEKSVIVPFLIIFIIQIRPDGTGTEFKLVIHMHVVCMVRS